MKICIILLFACMLSNTAQSQSLQSIIDGYQKAVGGKEKYPESASVIIKSKTQGGGGGRQTRAVGGGEGPAARPVHDVRVGGVEGDAHGTQVAAVQRHPLASLHATTTQEEKRKHRCRWAVSQETAQGKQAHKGGGVPANRIAGDCAGDNFECERVTCRIV